MKAVSKFTHPDVNVFLGASCPDLFDREWVKTARPRMGFHPSLKETFEIAQLVML